MVKVIRKGKKFGNHVVSYNGLKFDSKLELNCYKTIKIACSKKKLLLELQKPFKIDKIKRKYIADFVVTCPKTNKSIVIDAKGIETQIFKIKKVLLKIQGVDILCVNTPTKALAEVNKAFKD